MTGPPGSGKTVLIRTWIESCSTSWTWITVDRLMATSERFWHALVVGLQAAHPEFVFDAVDAIGGETIDSQIVVETLADDLVRRSSEDAPVIVIVDDAHHLDARSWEALGWLLDHHPSSLHLVLLSRSDPPFSVARLRAQGVLTEVRAADLVLDRNETAELFRRGSSDDRDWTPWAEALHDRTEGWLAGLRLAMMTMERGMPPDRVVAQIGDSHGVIAELLVTEALDSQPAHVRKFLRRTSCLEIIDPDLCDAITGRTDSRQLLRRLSADHLFVFPLDEGSDRYRYHPLLAEILRLELKSTEPAAEADITRRAAEWMVDRSWLASAVDHAVTGAHYGLAFEIITQNLRELYARGHRRDVGSWLLRLPDSYLLTDPDRTVTHCGALLFVLRPEWLRWLRLAKAVVPAGRADLQSRLSLLDALAWAGQGRVQEFERCATRSTELRDGTRGDPWDEVVMAWRTRLHTLMGDHDLATVLAIALNERKRQLVGDLPAMSLLAATLAAAGDPVGEDLAREVVVAWREAGEPDFFGMIDALCVAAMTALHDGEIDEAENLSAGAVALSELELPNLLTVRAEVAAASVSMATNRTAGVADRLGRLRATMVGQAATQQVLTLIGEAMPPSRSPAPPPPARPLIDPLTERELTILGYLESHLTFPEIADELYISRHTVKTHVARIYRKLAVTGRSAAVTTARRLELI